MKWRDIIAALIWNKVEVPLRRATSQPIEAKMTKTEKKGGEESCQKKITGS